MSLGPYAPREPSGRRGAGGPRDADAPGEAHVPRGSRGDRTPWGRAPTDGAGRPHDDGPAPVEERRRGASRVVPADHPSRDPRRPVRIGRGVSALLVGLCVLGALQASILIAVEVRRAWLADREVVRLEREVEALQREAADLAAIAERGDDVRFREHLARRQGYVHPDEVRFVIVPHPLDPAGEPPAPTLVPSTP